MTRPSYAPGPEVSVVVPAYDEAETIAETVERTRSALASFLPPGGFEVIVAEDGCTDRTPEIAASLAEDRAAVGHVHSDERLGRGAALERAFEAASGETLAYFDSDLATDLDYLEPLIQRVRRGECDVTTGSRWVPGHEADRPTKRALPSRGFNLATRWLLGSDLHDHQCGFKALSRAAFEDLRPSVEDDHWFWDTELLVAAQDRGFSVCEFPVEWTPKGDSKVDLVNDVLGMGGQLLRVFWTRSVTPRFHGRSGALLGLFASIGLLVGLILAVDPGRVVAELRRADARLILLAAGIYAASWPVRGIRYRSILEAMGHRIDLGLSTGAVFLSQTGNLVFPARAGDAVRAYLMKARAGIGYTTGAASLVVERVFDLLTITGLAGAVLLGLAVLAPERLLDATAAGLAGLPAGQRASARLALQGAAVVGGVALLSTVGVVLAGRGDGAALRRFLGRFASASRARRIAGFVDRFVGDVGRVARHPRAFLGIAATSLAIWVVDVLTALAVFAAFGVPAPPVALIAVGFLAVSVGNMAKVLPLSPSGIGLYEAVFTVVVVALTPASASASLALGVAIVDHAVKNAVTVAGGAGSAIGLNVPLRRVFDGRRSDAVGGRPGAAGEDPSD